MTEELKGVSGPYEDTRIYQPGGPKVEPPKPAYRPLTEQEVQPEWDLTGIKLRPGGTVSFDPEALTQIRKDTHGPWDIQSDIAQRLKLVLHSSPNWLLMSASQREALEMDMVKTSRILAGDFNNPDHWADKAGYIHLARHGDHTG